MMADHPGQPHPPAFSWNVGMVMHILKRDLVLQELEHVQVDVADHFNEEDHANNKLHYKINIIGQEANKNRRLRLEEAWMLLLNTHYPNGLNSKW